MRYLVALALIASAVGSRSAAAQAERPSFLVPITDGPRDDSPGGPDVLRVAVEAGETPR